MISPYPQKNADSVQSKYSTLNSPEPYSKYQNYVSQADDTKKKKKVWNRTWHDPINPKQPKHIHPQRMSNWTRNQQVIHIFLITATQTTTICQSAATEHKIIQSKDLAMSCYPHKECHPFWNLHFPNALPRESRKSYISNLMIERPNIKLPTSIESPTKSVTTSTPKNKSLNEMKKGVGSR